MDGSLFIVDVGNTETKLAVLGADGEPIPPLVHMATNRLKTELSLLLGDLAVLPVDALWGSCVVPEVKDWLGATLAQRFQKPMQWIRWPFLNPSVDFSGYPAGTLGTDRMANAVAGYAWSRPNGVIVVDFGTFTSFNVVDSRGRFIGGSLLPGLHPFLEIYETKGSQLPAVQMETCLSEKSLGLSTEESIQAGFSYGYPAMIQSLLRAVQTSRPEEKFQAVATGGMLETFFRLPQAQGLIEHLDPWLTLRGIGMIGAGTQQTKAHS